MRFDFDTQRHPRLTRAVHRTLGPPVAFMFALSDATGAAVSEFRRSFLDNYRAIRSWHADRREEDSP